MRTLREAIQACLEHSCGFSVEPTWHPSSSDRYTLIFIGRDDEGNESFREEVLYALNPSLFGYTVVYDGTSWSWVSCREDENLEGYSNQSGWFEKESDAQAHAQQLNGR